MRYILSQDVQSFTGFAYCKRLLCAFLLCFCVASLVSPATAFAEDDKDPIGKQLCTIVKAMQGNTAKAIATCALMAVAVGLFMGKMNWGTALTTAVGVIVIFGSGKVVTFLAGTDQSMDKCDTAEPTPKPTT